MDAIALIKVPLSRLQDAHGEGEADGELLVFASPDGDDLAVEPLDDGLKVHLGLPFSAEPDELGMAIRLLLGALLIILVRCQHLDSGIVPTAANVLLPSGALHCRRLWLGRRVRRELGAGEFDGLFEGGAVEEGLAEVRVDKVGRNAELVELLLVAEVQEVAAVDAEGAALGLRERDPVRRAEQRLAVGRQLHERLRGVRVLALLELVLACEKIDPSTTRKGKRRFMVDLYAGIDRRTTRR